MPTRQALTLAQEMGLDLVEITARAHPPVCRIMDYGKFKYEQSKKKKQQRKHASTVEIKEIKFRPKTEEHDLDFKTKHVRRFLEEGNKCRLVITFRGREITHPETGRNVLNKIVEATQDISHVEAHPNMEGRRMVMILAPKAGVVRKARATATAAVKEGEKAEKPTPAPKPAVAPGSDGKAASPAPDDPDDDDGDDIDDIDDDEDDDDDDIDDTTGLD